MRKRWALLLFVLATALFAAPGWANEIIETVERPLSQAYLDWKEKQEQKAAALEAGNPIEDDEPFYGLIPDPFDFSDAPLPPLRNPEPGLHDSRYIPDYIPNLTPAVINALPGYPSYSNPALPNIRDQSPYGTCWAFAATGAMEISALKQGLVTNPDFSELHLAWFAYKDPSKSFSLPRGSSIGILEQGGGVHISIPFFARLAGPVNESELPYTSATSANAVTGVKTNASDYPSNGIRLTASVCGKHRALISVTVRRKRNETPSKTLSSSTGPFRSAITQQLRIKQTWRTITLQQPRITECLSWAGMIITPAQTLRRIQSWMARGWLATAGGRELGIRGISGCPISSTLPTLRPIPQKQRRQG